MIARQGCLSRRQVLGGVAAGVAAATPRLALATPEQVAEEVKRLLAGRTPVAGKIKLDIPPVAENGLVVPVSFEVESPMTEQDHIRAVHLFAEGNPNPQVISFYFTPMVPKAAAQFRIRLAQTQGIVAYAEVSDGTVLTTRREVKVTIGGCGG